MASSRRRLLLIALSLSVCVHLVAALLILFLPRFGPRKADSHPRGTVELLMVEQKGAQPSQVNQPSDREAAQAPPEKIGTPKAQTQPPSSTALAAPPLPERGDEPAPPPAPPAPPKPAAKSPQPAAKEPAAQPAPPRAQQAPVFDLEGTGSESNAIVLGGHVLPAMPDDRFRNRPPLYPAEAAMLGQHGAVIVVIHVSENGLATGADVVESSGVERLDQAAVAAVRRWHFHPAMKDGRTVPFDMPFRFIFEPY